MCRFIYNDRCSLFTIFEDLNDFIDEFSFLFDSLMYYSLLEMLLVINLIANIFCT